LARRLFNDHANEAKRFIGYKCEAFFAEPYFDYLADSLLASPQGKKVLLVKLKAPHPFNGEKGELDIIAINRYFSQFAPVEKVRAYSQHKILVFFKEEI
jgi:hypothetical protein